jgi:glycosyltransferase involved in cell wall biosynthesis
MDKKFGLVYGRFLHGCCVAALLKNKVIFESHAPVFQKKKYEILLYKLLEKSKYFIKLIVISKALKKIYLEKSYLQAHHIEVAHDGADEVFDFETKVVLKGQKDSLKVGYVGHLYKGKGLEIIASIADKVSNDIEFHIIGGSEEDIEYWKSLIERDNVFFYGFIQQNIITHYINALDVCLLPNQRVVHTYKDKLNISDFTSPLKMFEYMAHKKAIISSNLPVLKEVLSINNSILVEPENKNAWVSAINILNNKLYREILSNQALSDFKKFSWKNRALKVLEGLNE